ncbi:ribosome biogenesis GTP-binding protein YsxC [Candidatus Kaiserbacteria bacterium]|nr:ribosome biogenesis GTP-binding protein YsxC [Candidatus Kaiserbacteria bacterium]
MKITSAVFKRGIVEDNEILKDGMSQIAFIGRSNAGKSSLLNSLTAKKNLAITSNTPGRTKEINIFLINGTHYFLDLPGYGYAKASGATLEKLSQLIYWYLFESNYSQKVVLIIDAFVGPTDDDLGMLRALEEAGKEIVVVANKVDKIKKSQYRNQLDKLKAQLVGHKLFPYSTKTKFGMPELLDELLDEVL